MKHIWLKGAAVGAAVLVGAMSSIAYAETCTVDGIEYAYQVLDDGTAEISGYGYQDSAIDQSTSGELTIPSSLDGLSVTSIGDYAFYNCTNLTSVITPECVTNIGDCAFESCTGLASVVISNGVTSIGYGAFNGCANIKFVAVPQAVCNRSRSIREVFSDSYSSVTQVVISVGVTSIGDSVFQGCENLITATIPDGVTNVGDCAFCNCTNLTSVVIPNTVTSIGNYAFGDCISLSSLAIPNDSAISIGGTAFSGCTSLSTIVMPNNSVVSIGNYAFNDCTSLTTVTIPKGVTNIGWGAFHGCTNITSVAIPNSAKEIGDLVFSNCAKIQSVTASQIVCDKRMSNVFSDSYSLVTQVVINAGVTNIGVYAFNGCTSLSAVVIPNTVVSIGEKAFSGCTNLTSVTIPDGVRDIGVGAFNSCKSLTEVEIPGSVVTIGNYYEGDYGLYSGAYSGCSSLTSVVIRAGVTSIGDYTFCGCPISFVVLPNTVSRIGDGAFSSCYELVGVEIPNSVTNIGSYTFQGCTNLISVTIPDSVISIEEGAFGDCTSLFSLGIPNSLRTIGDYAFGGCLNLSAITLPEGLTNISDYAFYDCINLMSINIPSTVRRIGDEAFIGTGLYYASKDNFVILDGWLVGAKRLPQSDITIPKTVQHIADRALYGQVNLTSVIIPDGVESIGKQAFHNCPCLSEVVIASSVTNMGECVFGMCGGDGTYFSWYRTFIVITFLGMPPVVNGEVVLMNISYSCYAFSDYAIGYYPKAYEAEWKAELDETGRWHGLMMYNEEWGQGSSDKGDGGSSAGAEDYGPAPSEDGAVDLSAAQVYNGCLYDGEGLAGTIQVKAAKQRGTTSKLVIAIQVAGEKKVVIRGNMVVEEGAFVGEASDGRELKLELGANGMSGSFGEYMIDGARDVFSSKAKEDKSAAAEVLGVLKENGAVMIAWEEEMGWSGLSVTVGNRGRTKVVGTLADGTKVSTSVQMIVGEEWCVVPVVYVKKGVKLAFNVWLARDGSDAEVDGLGDDVIIGGAESFDEEAVFYGSVELVDLLEDETYAEYFPDGMVITASGTKWILPRAGKVALKNGEVDESKLGENPSGLKLAYRAKDGTFSGSFKVYMDYRGKPRATVVSVAGVMIDGVGYGTATIRKVGSVPITIE